MAVAFISAIGHQKRITTQKVIPIFRWGIRLILRHCLELEYRVDESKLESYSSPPVLLEPYLW